MSDDGPNVYNLDLDAYVPRDPGRTRTWKDIDDDPSLPVCGPADDPALSPGCAILDNGPRDSSALGDESLLAVTQNANVVLCIGGSNGLAPSEASFADYLGSIATPAARQRIEILEGYAHRDVLTAAQNEAVPLLADGIAGLSRRR